MTNWDEAVPRYGEDGPDWWLQVAQEGRFVQFVDVVEYRDPKPDYPWWYLLWREFGLDELTGQEIPVIPDRWPHDPILFFDDPDIAGVEFQQLSEEHTIYVTRGWEGGLPEQVLSRIVTLQDFVSREQGVDGFTFGLRLRFGPHSGILFALEIVMACRDNSGEVLDIVVARWAEGEWVTTLGQDAVTSLGWRTLLHLDRECFRPRALVEGDTVDLSLDWAGVVAALWDSRLPLKKQHFEGLDAVATAPADPRTLPPLSHYLAQVLNGLGGEGVDGPPIEILDAVLAAQNILYPGPGTFVNPVGSLKAMAEALAEVRPQQLIDSLCNSIELSDDADEVYNDFSWSSWLIEFLNHPFGCHEQTGMKQCFSIFAQNYHDYSTATFFFDTETSCVYATPSPEGPWESYLDALDEIPGAERWNADRHSNATGGFDIRAEYVELPEVAFAVILRALRVMGWDYRKTRLKLMIEVREAGSRTGGRVFG